MNIRIIIYMGSVSQQHASLRIYDLACSRLHHCMENLMSTLRRLAQLQDIWQPLFVIHAYMHTTTHAPCIYEYGCTIMHVSKRML